MAESSDWYFLVGQFFELCDCYTICPCWIGQTPDEGSCTGAFAWSIEQGHIGGLDVSGRKVVSVSFHQGHRDNGNQQVYLFIDDGADDEAHQLLTQTFTGQRGGPLAELARLMGQLKMAMPAPIELVSEGDHLSITVGRYVRGDGTVLRGDDGAVTELRHGRLTGVLGPHAEVGRTSTFRVDLGYELSAEVSGRAAMRGPFEYSYAGS